MKSAGHLESTAPRHCAHSLLRTPSGQTWLGSKRKSQQRTQSPEAHPQNQLCCRHLQAGQLEHEEAGPGRRGGAAGHHTVRGLQGTWVLQ